MRPVGRKGTKCDCKCDRLWVRFLIEESSPHLIFSFFRSSVEAKCALSSTTQHAIPLEFDGEWETECLNTSVPQPTLLCVEYITTPKKR